MVIRQTTLKNGNNLPKLDKILIETITELSGDTITILDPRDYTILHTNCDSKNDTIVGRKCHDVFHSSDVPCWMNGSRCPIRIVTASRRSISVDHEHRSPDGLFEMMEILTIPIMDSSGETHLIVQRSTPTNSYLSSSNGAKTIDGTGVGLKALAGLSLKLLESQSLEDSLGCAVSEIRNALRVSIVYVGRLNGDSGKTSTVLASDKNPSTRTYAGDQSSISRMDRLSPFLRKQISNGEGYWGNSCDLPPEDVHTLLRNGITSIAALPVFSDLELWGYLVAETTSEPREWNGTEIRTLQAAARILSSVIEKWSALKELKRSLEITRQAFTGIAEALATALEKRDPYTAGHQKRVVRIAMAIGEKLLLSRESMECLQTASLLHDVGKIRIPTDILNRPGKLTDLEWSFIKSHPQEGYDILSTVNFPWPVAQVVLQHHERYDGSGYPNGLEGDEICIEASILGLADVVEAMTTHRPYRPSLSSADMEREIESNKRILYHPKVVDAFLEIHRAIEL
ncbi:MAG: HD domain-containing protein [Candidatus Aegiribacteria sp.]|nr:HD domain-containing protein [Candidatus Aegiribacteria sp.]